MKILLCTLTGQHIPNLLSIHHYKPDKLVLLETPKMKNDKAGMNFLAALEKGGLDFSDDSIMSLSNEDSLTGMRQTLETIYAEYSEAEWIINLTGGTKLMSIAVYSFFRDKNAIPIYVNFSERDVFLNLNNNHSEKGIYKPTIEEFVIGYGFTLDIPQKAIEKDKTRASEWWECSRAIASRETQVIKVDNPIRKKFREKGGKLLPEHFASITDSTEQILEQTFHFSQLDGYIDKYAGDFLTGGWLEIFLFGLLNRHKDKLEIWDLNLGLRLKNEHSSNEYDISFMKNYDLCSIECKTGHQNQEEIESALYKLDSATGQFKALGIKIFFVNTSDHMLENSEVKAKFANRADTQECVLLTQHSIQKLAKNWDDVETIKEIFKW